VLAAVLDRDGQLLSATQDRHRALANGDHLAILHAIWTADTTAELAGLDAAQVLAARSPNGTWPAPATWPPSSTPASGTASARPVLHRSCSRAWGGWRPCRSGRSAPPLVACQSPTEHGCRCGYGGPGECGQEAGFGLRVVVKARDAQFERLGDPAQCGAMVAAAGGQD
jgi:hypothetical protein